MGDLDSISRCHKVGMKKIVDFFKHLNEPLKKEYSNKVTNTTKSRKKNLVNFLLSFSIDIF